ncbi:AraC family transcriptional regulator [Labilibaculum antarcticum]|uniref:HTH araC/xylS-type domain-containing protein n=1 Tax=Labilibaculum antarcticum TaxID=1717717 RepID=A0A1Y1CEG1_9BACT|nr:AraC family transcriptional regulator [Labilibaculum antarcticum]BAX78700.1 hypothetical protein ALGA_0305 [Labilibaculum antarcticum]
MIPKVERVEKRNGESFVVGKYSNKWFERTWHYHPEYELLLITKGSGIRVIGNNRSTFKEGDLVLVGGDIPHAWFSDASFFEADNHELCESTYVQFNRSIFGNHFANLPEMKNIQRMLDEAKFGLNFWDVNKSEIFNQIKDLPNSSGLTRLLSLIKILELFMQGKPQLIISKDYFTDSFISKSVRIRKVHEYVMNYYMDDISLQNAAKLVEMNVSSFCRFFKKMTKRTFSQYVKETRIDFAQQLLINTELASNQIGFECGFSSVAYFNQCFKSISDMSPLEYRSRYKKI